MTVWELASITEMLSSMLLADSLTCSLFGFRSGKQNHYVKERNMVTASTPNESTLSVNLPLAWLFNLKLPFEVFFTLIHLLTFVMITFCKKNIIFEVSS